MKNPVIKWTAFKPALPPNVIQKPKLMQIRAQSYPMNWFLFINQYGSFD
jgi:hypothetical protein